jgi:hypothetical protein
MPREKNPESTTTRKRAPRKQASQPVAEMPRTEVQYPAFVDPQQRASLIATAAYLRAQNRGFQPGHELEDWLAAEAEVDAHLMRGSAESARA